jgi:hypothetical protein
LLFYSVRGNANSMIRTVIKKEFASNNTTGTTFAFNAYFLSQLAPLADERKGFFYRISIATIDAIEHVFIVANSYLPL